MPASKLCTTAQEIKAALAEAEAVREEGICIKVRLRQTLGPSIPILKAWVARPECSKYWPGCPR